MASSVKASKFNAQAIAASAVPRRRITNGTPTRPDSTGLSMNNLVRLLSKNGYMPQDTGDGATFEDVAELCLSAMAITVETIDSEERSMTFRNIDKKPQNEADKNNESQRKNYTDDTFPNENDPYYEMDQSPPDFVKKRNENAKQSSRDNDRRAIVELLTRIGMESLETPENLKLKQLVGNK